MPVVEALLEGLLLPCRWGHAGDVAGIGLTTFDENEYRIDPGPAERYGMAAHLRRHVRLLAGLDGDRVVEVIQFEVLDGG